MEKIMTRKLFTLTMLSLAVCGILILAAPPTLHAQSAPPPPNAPTISLSATPQPPPPYGPNNPGPTSLIFSVKFTDSTDGATIVYNVTGPNGPVASGTISAPSFSSTPSGTVSVQVPINATSGYTATAYAYIPANNSTCPPTPPSGNSPTTTQYF
jgi:hypothetical protein